MIVYTVGFMRTVNAETWEAWDYPTRLQALTQAGWQVVSEGPSGAQMKKAKVLRTADKWCIGIGVPLVFFWGFGLLLIAVGMLDYWFFTKDETYFLARAAAPQAAGH